MARTTRTTQQPQEVTRTHQVNFDCGHTEVHEFTGTAKGRVDAIIAFEDAHPQCQHCKVLAARQSNPTDANPMDVPFPLDITPAQERKLRQLILSSAFTEQERESTLRWLDSGNATCSRASKGIDWALARIAERDAQKAASEEAKADYRNRSEGRPMDWRPAYGRKPRPANPTEVKAHRDEPYKRPKKAPKTRKGVFTGDRNYKQLDATKQRHRNALDSIWQQRRVG